MGTKENFPPPGGGEFVTIECPSQTAPKRGRESPEKASNKRLQTKQTKKATPRTLEIIL